MRSSGSTWNQRPPCDGGRGRWSACPTTDTVRAIFRAYDYPPDRATIYRTIVPTLAPAAARQPRAS